MRPQGRVVNPDSDGRPRAEEPKGPDLTAFEESGTATAVTGAITFESGSALVPPFRLVGLRSGLAV